jgi:hypothetical protein
MTDENNDDKKPEEQTIHEKLKAEIEEADWSMLEAHHERQALILVSSELDLPEVGEKVAQDDVENIKQWMTAGKLGKPEDAQISNWKENPYKKGFRFIIVQPYVLIQEIQELKQ